MRLADQRKERTGRGESAGCHRRSRAAADGLGGSAASRADLRFLVRRLSRRGGARARDGRLLAPASARFASCSNNEVYEVESLGALTPKPVVLQELAAGEVGFIIANIKRVADARVGDTVIDAARPAPPLPGFEAIKPMVFAGLYPVQAHHYEMLRDALGKLQLNDAAFFYEPENSVALGFGFRCGFLGLLHMDIVQERLEREFGIDLITTAPSVRYRITTTSGDVLEVDNPTKFPSPSEIAKIEEPVITAMIITADDSVGAILQLCEEKRGVQKGFEYLSPHARDAHLRIAAE